MKTIKAKVHRLPFTEEWKPVIGYEGRYEVSNYGKVKSLARKVDRDYRPYSTKEKLLKTYIDSYGKLCVGLTKNGKTKQYSVYRLVAIAFIPNPENKREVNHIDFDKSNACIQNLEWTTPTENRLHSYHQRNKHQGLTNNSHLYITTDDEIKKGDNVLVDLYPHGDPEWNLGRVTSVYDSVVEVDLGWSTTQTKTRDICRKIIATTDPKLWNHAIHSEGRVKVALPQIPQSFIEEYCKAGGIDEVLVEYMDIEMCFNYNGAHFGKDCSCKGGDFRYLPKLTTDNTIIIHPVEEKMYSKEEVINAFKYAFKEAKEAVIWSSDYPIYIANKWIEENL